MYPGLGGVLEFLIFIWLLGLSLAVWKNNLFLKKLFPQKGERFKERLEEVLLQVKEIEVYKSKSAKFFQKIALKRYNPYRDTGGDQSFSIALLDGEDNGMVVTSLHSRAGTRIFAKPVKKGKEDDFEFSDEEKEVLKKAIIS